VVDIHNDHSNDGYDYGDSSDSDWAPSKKSRSSEGGDAHATDSYLMSTAPSRKGGRRRNDENVSMRTADLFRVQGVRFRVFNATFNNISVTRRKPPFIVHFKTTPLGIHSIKTSNILVETSYNT
jgi:hypothetical protein